ncbi:MAG: hypothetical protein JJU00_12660 [Opitutales bacterium]|nr:hypothetical protein [Opitutales bacterium]
MNTNPFARGLLAKKGLLIWLPLMLAASLAKGQTFYYNTVTDPYFYLNLRSPLSTGAQNVSFDNMGGYFEASVNTEELTMSFDRVLLDIGSGTYSASREITTGFNETRTISATIQFEPISIELNDVDTLNLTPTTGGDFSYGESYGVGSGNFAGNFVITFTGNYEMTDGSDFRAGTFDFDLLIASYTTTGLLITDNFPDEITIGRSGVSPWRTRAFPSEQSSLFISETYGIADVAFSIAQIGMGTDNIMTMSQIPEPRSTTLALSMAVFGLFIIRRFAIRRRP